MLTILTWLWTQPGSRTKYSAANVNIWADMLARHVTLPHEIACVTDMPHGIASNIRIIEPPGEFEDIRLPTWPDHRPQCLRRLTMFRRDAAGIFGERFACFDLDCVIGGSLDPILSIEDDFRIAPGTAPSRPYNGSLFILTAGSRPQVYETFTRAGAVAASKRFVGSDQAWIAQCLGPGERTWVEADGLVYQGLGRHPSTYRRVMFFPGSTKPWSRFHDPWVTQHYRREPQGRCLVLGYDDTLWDDVELALETGPFDAVIASPEAAEHWPGEILAVARDNDDAARLAHLYGFDNVTWCGVKEKEAA